ncbi:MAG: GvpL/GvpF family gas vesicle protein [Elainellaceae cyanobacterium]
MTTNRGLYLYGIAPAPATFEIDLEGLDKQPVHMHQVDDCVFLYSAAQQSRYLASRKNLLGHERVLEQAMTAGYQNLLPLQFGLVIGDWDTVREQLISPHSKSLVQLFQKLTNHREVGVKIFWDATVELEMLMQENERLRQERDRLDGKALSMEDVISIGQSIEQAMNDRKETIINHFQDMLNSMAVEIVENDPMTETMIYNAAYLIGWDDEPQFSQKVEALDSEFEGRLRIRYNNFTAPFNFAQIERD